MYRRRFAPHFLTLLFLGTVWLLRQAWLISHSCIPVATYKLQLAARYYDQSPVFARDSKTFMLANEGDIYQFKTSNSQLINHWNVGNSTTEVIMSMNPDEWILISNPQKISGKIQIFSSKSGKIVDSFDSLKNIEGIDTFSFNSRFFIGKNYKPIGDTKQMSVDQSQPYRVYDRETKQQVSLPVMQKEIRHARFWPNDKTVCITTENKNLVLFDAITGKEVAFPAPLQTRASQILAVRRGKDKQEQYHHSIIFKDGTVEYYKGDSFNQPDYTFKIPPSPQINYQSLYLETNPYLVVNYGRIKGDGQNKNTHYENYIGITDIFSLESGKQLAHFSLNYGDQYNVQETVEKFGGANLFTVQSRYKVISKPSFSSASSRGSLGKYESIAEDPAFYQLPRGKRFGFQTRPLLTQEGVVVPEKPSAFNGGRSYGRLSPDGQYFVSMQGIPQSYNNYSYASYLEAQKSYARVTTWKLLE
jgi:hypothetical protein